VQNENSDIDDIVQALLRLQALKIERVYDITAEAILLAYSFEAMEEVMQMRDQAIALINVKTEKELIKYKAKS
jgi:hypothetical protein